MRELHVNEIDLVSGGELRPDEGAYLEMALAGLVVTAGAPAIALAAIGAAALCFALD